MYRECNGKHRTQQHPAGIGFWYREQIGSRHRHAVTIEDSGCYTETMGAGPAIRIPAGGTELERKSVHLDSYRCHVEMKGMANVPIRGEKLQVDPARGFSTVVAPALTRSKGRPMSNATFEPLHIKAKSNSSVPAPTPPVTKKD